MKKRRKLKIFLCICALLIIVIAGYLIIPGWIDGMPKLKYDYNTDAAAPAAYPDADFAVISDLHIYDPSLGTTGPAFEATMGEDRKLLLDGIDLLDFAIDSILHSNARFVLISGDLTKDGELICHRVMSERLTRLTEVGLKVYVVPGNHDVNNPDAVSYSGDVKTPVENISADDFARIYAEFGYNDSLKRDPNSLSYVAEPVEGLWLLAVDACRYRENVPGGGETVGGKLSQDTENWIEDVLKEALQKGKAVVAMVHHGIVEHWNGQYKLHPDFLIEDYAHFGKLLASYNVRLVFTGHYHAQDITRGVFDDKYIYDIETGSLVTAPCPIRYCSLRNNNFSVESVTIVDKIHPGTDFAQTSNAFVKATVVSEAINTLNKYKVSGGNADYIADAVGDAFAAHYSGDENPADRPVFDNSRLSLWGRFIYSMQKYVLDGMWMDLYPADNNVSFSLG